jgi:hypothetical protein
MPTARAGAYRAPVDTAGMDPDMKATLGLTPVDKPAKKDNPVVAGIKKMFGGTDRPMKTAAAKSDSVKRTSDIPRHFTDVEADSILGVSRNPTRTSDKPVMKKGQGLYGQMHKNTGAGAGGPGSGSIGHGK